MITLNEIRTLVQARDHTPAQFEALPNQASVAMILADGEDDLEVCFIRRADREGDPWSGQVAFPGGRAGGSDLDAQGVAERETHEEVGLRLYESHRVGPLPTRQISRPGVDDDMVLSPFIYHIGAGKQASAFVREPAEVANVFWVPMQHLFDEASATELEYPMSGSSMSFPGIRFEDHVIWGLTLNVLDSFAQIMQCKLPSFN